VILKIWNYIKKKVDDHLFLPFRESEASSGELALGTAIGMFWALTPLVGIQMWLVSINWFFFRSLKIRFNLAVGLALVWITNPVTMPVFYYTFYLCGYWLFSSLGADVHFVNYDLFKDTLSRANDMDLWHGLFLWGKFMVIELGWPMLIGSFTIGLPTAVLSYPAVTFLIKRYRKKKFGKTAQS